MRLYNPQGDLVVGGEIELSTREGNRIPNEQRSPRPLSAMQDASRIHRAEHQSLKLRSLSSLYNCMGMVFASRRTGIHPSELEMILTEDGYRQIGINELEAGDVVVYHDSRGEVSHVGIVDHVGFENPRKVRVLSQWGADGEYYHLADDVSPALGSPSEYWTDRES